jgi:predicted metal-dependent hydrolase
MSQDLRRTTLDLFNPPPDTLAEPRVTRLGEQDVAYTLKRSAKRRRIVLTVDERGLVVHVPWRTSEREVAEVIAQAQSWILRKLATWEDNKPRDRSWTHGELLDFLGRQLTLTLIERDGTTLTRLQDAGILEVALPAPHAPERVRDAVVRWYRRHAIVHFADRVQHFCARMQIAPPKVFLSSARTRWGSCNAEREIRLNWRLMQAARHVIDYVVAHEVAHLQVLSHSSRFWRVVQRLYPDYEGAKAELSAMSQHYMAL